MLKGPSFLHQCKTYQTKSDLKHSLTPHHHHQNKTKATKNKTCTSFSYLRWRAIDTNLAPAAPCRQFIVKSVIGFVPLCQCRWSMGLPSTCQFSSWIPPCMAQNVHCYRNGKRNTGWLQSQMCVCLKLGSESSSLSSLTPWAGCIWNIWAASESAHALLSVSLSGHQLKNSFSSVVFSIHRNPTIYWGWWGGGGGGTAS